MLRIVLAMLALPFLAVLVYFNYLWSAVILVCLALGLVISLRSTELWPKFVLIGLAVLALMVAFFTDWLPHPRERSITFTRLPIHNVPVEDPEPPGQSEDLRKNFEEEYLLRKTRVSAVEAAPVLETRAREMLIQVRQMRNDLMPIELEAKLDEAIQHLHESIQGQDLRRRADKTRLLLEETRKKLGGLEDPQAISTAGEKLDEQYHAMGIDPIYENMTEVEKAIYELLKTLAKQLVEDSHELTVRLHEAASQLEIEEKIAIRSQVPIREIEIGDLLLDYRAQGLKPEIWAAYDCRSWARLDVPQLRRNQKAVCLRVRTVVPTPVSPLPTKLRAPEFLVLDITMPPLQKRGRLQLLLDLTQYKLPSQTPYTLDVERDRKIREIQIPRYSYFQSPVPFKVERAGAEDWLQCGDEIRPSYFVDHGPIRIELLPRSPLFRNILVQKYKEYLFVENAFMGLVLASVSSIVGAALGRSRED